MSKKIEITKIKLTIEGNVIEISADSARQLREELNNIFGEKYDDLLELYKKTVPKDKEYIPYPVPYPVPYPAPQPPWETFRPEVTWTANPIVYCKTTDLNSFGVESYEITTEIH